LDGGFGKVGGSATSLTDASVGFGAGVGAVSSAGAGCTATAGEETGAETGRFMSAPG